MLNWDGVQIDQLIALFPLLNGYQKNLLSCLHLFEHSGRRLIGEHG